MLLGSVCLVLAAVWTLLAYVVLPLPIEDHLFAWLRRQWLFEGSALLSGLGALALTVACWRRRLRVRMAWWPAWLLWIAWCGVSFLYSVDQGLTLRAWTAFASYGLLAWSACALVRSEDDLVVWTRFLALLALVAAGEGLYQYIYGFSRTLPLYERLRSAGTLDLQGWGGDVIQDFLIRKRITSLFGWPNLFAGFVILMTPLAIGLSRQAKARGERIAWGVGAVVLGACLVLTLSMGGWFATILMLGFGWWLLRRKPGRGPAAAEGAGRPSLVRTFVVAALICGVVAAGSYILARRARPLIVGSVSSRLVYVQTACAIASAYPVAGTGFGTFGVAYWALMPMRFAGGQHAAIHAHNTLLELAAELGLIGLVLFLWFMWRIGRLVAGGASAPVGAPGRAVRQALAIGVLGFFIHTLIEQTFFEAVTVPFWWIAIGLLTSQPPLPPGGGVQAVRGVRLMPRPEDTTEGEAASEASVGRGTLRVPLRGLTAAMPPRHQPPAGDSTQRSMLPLIGQGVGFGLFFLLLARFMLADAWAARGAFLRVSTVSPAGCAAFSAARRWDPLSHRYPLEEAECLLGLAQRQRPEEAAASRSQAIERLQRTVQRSPWLGYGWMRLGQTQWALGRREEAISSMQMAVRRDPNSMRALNDYTDMLMESGHTIALREAAQRLQRRDASDARGWFLEAQALEKVGQAPAAQAVYEELLRRFPSHHAAWFNLAALRQRRGDAQAAATAYRRFLELAPPQPEAPRQAALAFLQGLEINGKKSP